MYFPPCLNNSINTFAKFICASNFLRGQYLFLIMWKLQKRLANKTICNSIIHRHQLLTFKELSLSPFFYIQVNIFKSGSIIYVYGHTFTYINCFVLWLFNLAMSLAFTLYKPLQCNFNVGITFHHMDHHSKLDHPSVVGNLENFQVFTKVSNKSCKIPDRKVYLCI